MINKIEDSIRIKDIPALTLKYDFIFALCTFLDEFYECDNTKKESLLIDEPDDIGVDKTQRCILAASAHKLANDYQCYIPDWVMKDMYFMPFL